MEAKKGMQAALIAALLASAGGAAFLHKHPNPSLREVYASCEKGEVTGLACCEDMLRVSHPEKTLQECGMVTPDNHDPFGIRAREEIQWDAALKAEKANH